MKWPAKTATAFKARPLQFGPKAFAALLAALFLAVLAFSHAAASTGLDLRTFRPLGGSFFSWRISQNALAVRLYEQRNRKVPAATLLTSGRLGVSYAPLSARSLWLIGKGHEAAGDVQRARIVMERANAVTRRDPAVQLWLAEDALSLRRDVAAALRHYDLIIRSEPDASNEVLTRLSTIITIPEGRKFLQPYIRNNNPWFAPLLSTATDSLRRAEPIGRLLLERGGKLPADPRLEPTYGQIISRLVSEGSADLAVKIYPLLPNGRLAALSNVSGVANGKAVSGYPPFIWSYGAENAGATPVATGDTEGLEFFGSPGTIAVAASKLLATSGINRLQWQVSERTPNVQSSATWEATCLSGAASGSRTASINLLDQAAPLNTTLAMALPGNCAIVRLDMRIAGGIGSSPTAMIVTGLKVVPTAAPE